MIPFYMVVVEPASRIAPRGVGSVLLQGQRMNVDNLKTLTDESLKRISNLIGEEITHKMISRVWKNHVTPKAPHRDQGRREEELDREHEERPIRPEES